MTGPEHYRQAEGFLAAAQADQPGRPDSYRADQLRAAQAHATLALAAATAYPAIKDWIGDEATDGSGWDRVTS